MDAASQIATLGLGFSPTAFFGTTHYLESWLNNKYGNEFKNIRNGLESFLKRKSGMENLDEDQEVEYELVEKDGKTSAENLK